MFIVQLISKNSQKKHIIWYVIIYDTIFKYENSKTIIK